MKKFQNVWVGMVLKDLGKMNHEMENDIYLIINRNP